MTDTPRAIAPSGPLTLSTRRLTATLMTALAATTLVPTMAVAAPAPSTGSGATGSPGTVQGGDGLAQSVGSDEPVSQEPVVFTQGHLDIGPRVQDGAWTLLIRDDSASAPVWRDLSRTVIQVPDDARLAVPDDPAYAFLGAQPGTAVWVLPQVERQGAPWPGWNTQDPGALAAMGRGATFTLDAVQGPGAMVMYLENGTLEEPQVLWDSQKADRSQPLFAEANTHTHANWVFTKPGIYRLRITVRAEGASGQGQPPSDTRTLTFAVGSATDPQEGFTPVSDQELLAGASGGDHAGPSGPLDSVESWMLWSGGALVIVIGGFVAVAVRTGRTGADETPTPQVTEEGRWS